MENSIKLKKAYEHAKIDTLSKFPEMQIFFDFIEGKPLYKSGEESPLKSEKKRRKYK